MHALLALPLLALAPASAVPDAPAAMPILPAVACAGQAAMSHAAAASAGSPDAVDPDLLATALASLQLHGCANPRGETARALLVVDFALPSRRPRAWLIDLATGDGMTGPFLVAHGSGSDPAKRGFAEIFSDRPDTLMTALGAYRVGEAYVGVHGLSLRLDGLDVTNINARGRSIVIHSADYVSAVQAEAMGRIGRSSGCLAFETSRLTEIIEGLQQGGFVYAGLSIAGRRLPRPDKQAATPSIEEVGALLQTISEVGPESARAGPPGPQPARAEPVEALPPSLR